MASEPQGHNKKEDEEFGHFWEKKISSFVKRVDQNKDGVISIEEFEWLADRYFQMSGCCEEKASGFRAELRQIWAVYFEGPSKQEPVTPKVYCRALRELGKPKLVQVVTHFFPRFFDAIEKNSEGNIGLEEYRQFLDMFGMDPGDAEDAFSHLDTDNDGILSREEFLAASLEFCCGDDESSPYQYFLGRLLD